MSSLIQSLVAQHDALRATVATVDESFARSDLAETKVLFDRFRNQLLEHLSLEDRELYPGLQRQAQANQDPRLESVARAFASTMGNISAGLSQILARYEKGIARPDDFRRDWELLKDVLGSRMRSEEASLYRLFDASEKPRASNRL